MNTREDEEQYRSREKAFRESLSQLVGKLLKRVRLKIVEPEINQIVLEFADATFLVQGQIGGELVGVIPASSASIADDPGYSDVPFHAAAELLGRKVSQVRAIGEAWNGHGLEISFVGRPARTLIVQSIYAPEAPEGFNDCLRIAVVSYTYSAHLLLNEPGTSLTD